MATIMFYYLAKHFKIYGYCGWLHSTNCLLNYLWSLGIHRSSISLMYCFWNKLLFLKFMLPTSVTCLVCLGLTWHAVIYRLFVENETWQYLQIHAWVLVYQVEFPCGKRLLEEDVRIPEGQATAFCTHKLMCNDIFNKFCLVKLTLYAYMYICVYTYVYRHTPSFEWFALLLVYRNNPSSH